MILRYEIPSRQDVTIGVYDVTGRLVKTYGNNELDPGEYMSSVSLAGIPSGMYYCTLRAGERVLRQRFVHIR